MGLGIVADINSARAQQGEHFVKQDMLADAAIGEHEVQGIRRSRCTVALASSVRIVSLGSLLRCDRAMA